jgi:hypothetical protein
VKAAGPKGPTALAISEGAPVRADAGPTAGPRAAGGDQAAGDAAAIVSSGATDPAGTSVASTTACVSAAASGDPAAAGEPAAGAGVLLVLLQAARASAMTAINAPSFRLLIVAFLSYADHAIPLAK